MIGGDFNVIPEDIDCHKPSSWMRTHSFNQSRERAIGRCSTLATSMRSGRYIPRKPVNSPSGIISGKRSNTIAVSASLREGGSRIVFVIHTEIEPEVLTVAGFVEQKKEVYNLLLPLPNSR